MAMASRRESLSLADLVEHSLAPLCSLQPGSAEPCVPRSYIVNGGTSSWMILLNGAGILGTIFCFGLAEDSWVFPGFCRGDEL